MAFIVRILLIFLVVSTVVSLIRGFLRGSGDARRPLRPAAGSSGRLVKDPVCGTYIPENAAFRAADQLFCSEECRTRFLQDRA